jgi:NitT/TauT family transport system substrate-binding protein
MSVAIFAGSLLLAACGGESEGSNGGTDGPVTVQIGRAPAFPQFPLFVAEDKGYWEEAGIDAEFVSIASGPEGTAAQVSGALDIVDNVPNNLLPIIDKGVDIKAFTVTMKASQFDIIVSKDYALTSEQGDWQGVMKELEGANVGVIALGTGAEDIARTLFQEAGVDPDKQVYIATGLPPTTLAAMQNKQIDMAITLEPGIATAVQSGLAVTPFSVRAGEAPDSLIWPGVVGTATTEYAEENPEILDKYIAVMEKTLAFIHDPANKDEVIELMGKDLSIQPDVANYLYENNLDQFADHVALTDDDIEQLGNAATWVKDLGKITQEFTGADFTMKIS